MKRLTDTLLQSLKPKKSPYRVFDTVAQGFNVQVSVGGYLQFSFWYTKDRRKHRVPIGRYIAPIPASAHGPAEPSNLDYARDKALRYRAMLGKDIDPKEHIAEQQRKAEAEKPERTVGELVELYLSTLEGRTSYDQASRALRGELLKQVDADTPASQVSTDDCLAVLNRINRRGAPTLANRCRQYMHACYEYGMKYGRQVGDQIDERFNLATNPVSSIGTIRAAERAGERALSLDELRQLWAELDGQHRPSDAMRTILKLQILTGQRVTMWTRAKKTEFDLTDGVWTLSSERMKAGKGHAVPLSDTAVALIALQMERALDSEYLFPGRGTQIHIEYSVVGKAVAQLCADTDLVKFTARDLRRSWRTLASEQGYSEEVIERLMAHSQTGTTGRKHYDRSTGLTQGRPVMQAISDLITKPEPLTDSVVQFRKQA